MCRGRFAFQKGRQCKGGVLSTGGIRDLLSDLTPDVSGSDGAIFRFSNILGHRRGGGFTAVFGLISPDGTPGVGRFGPDPDQLHRVFHHDLQHPDRQLLNHAGKPKLYFSLSHTGAIIRSDSPFATIPK